MFRIIILNRKEILITVHAGLNLYVCSNIRRGRRGHDRMVSYYICNECLSPLKLWVRIPFMVICTR